MRTKFRIIFLIIWIGIIRSAIAVQSRTRTYGEGWSVTFVNESPGQSGKMLSCRDRILGRISIPRGAGERNLRTIWFRPDGSVEQEASFPIRFSAHRSGQAVVWLRLNPGTRGIFGDFTLGDFGGVDHPFDGVWRFEMYEEGHFVLRERFEVSCID